MGLSSLTFATLYFFIVIIPGFINDKKKKEDSQTKLQYLAEMPEDMQQVNQYNMTMEFELNRTKNSKTISYTEVQRVSTGDEDLKLKVEDNN